MGKNVIACICEGSAEEVILNKLLDNHKLIFERDDLLDLEIIRCRKARNFEKQYLSKDFSEKIMVYRIIDSRKENFKLSKAYEQKVDVINIVTAPEIEMLVIINEGKYQEYSKYKSKMSPSRFCMEVLKCGKVKHSAFVKGYFSNCDDLVKVIHEYKRLAKIPKDEKCLVDLLK